MARAKDEAFARRHFADGSHGLPSRESRLEQARSGAARRWLWGKPAAAALVAVGSHGSISAVGLRGGRVRAPLVAARR